MTAARSRQASSRSTPGSRPWLAFLAGCFAATLAALLVVNFSPGEKKIETHLTRLYGAGDAQFEHEMGTLLGPPVVGGNRHQTLLNGAQIFPAMLEGIASAKQTITFETYIYWSGDIGQKFADALAERARAGVKVHVLLDWIGSSKIDQALLDRMESAGIQLKRFHEPKWYHLGRLNNRTHRKLLVIDGRVGFTGGVGIAPKWDGHAQDPEHWRDTHFRVEGPVAAQMQAVFIDNWTKASGEVLHGPAYFPPVASAGTQRAQMFSSSPSGGSDSMHLMYLMAITAAARSIDISNAYFVPDHLTRSALAAAAKRGVKVRIIVPGPVTDAETVQAASRADWGELLEAGVRIWQYQPTMFHCKVLVVDDRVTSVGSTNFDPRSFRLNDEANLNVYDEAFAREQTAVFEKDLVQSQEVTLQQWQDRPLKEKALEKLASLLSAQL